MPRILLISITLALLWLPGLVRAKDPYKELPSDNATQHTADEPFSSAFSLDAAARYLDEGAHLMEHNCYACHSTFTYLPARSILDPLADEVLRTRIMLERFNEKVLDPKQRSSVKSQHISRVQVLSAVEFARLDAATTGRLAPVTRKMLDAMWSFQLADGGIDWIRVREAPQAIDNYWPAAQMAIGVAAAPEGYAETEKARTGIAKLRAWFKAHPPETLHERGLILQADAAIGKILTDEERNKHIAALQAKQREDGGWCMTDLAPWKRKDGKALDENRSDGYATAFITLALVQSGVSKKEAGIRKSVDWLKRNQRRSGGWFTQSPFHRDRIASNTGASFAIQALEACGEITRPKITEAQFQAAYAKVKAQMPETIFLPDQAN